MYLQFTCAVPACPPAAAPSPAATVDRAGSCRQPVGGPPTVLQLPPGPTGRAPAATGHPQRVLLSMSALSVVSPSPRRRASPFPCRPRRAPWPAASPSLLPPRHHSPCTISNPIPHSSHRALLLSTIRLGGRPLQPQSRRASPVALSPDRFNRPSPAVTLRTHTSDRLTSRPRIPPPTQSRPPSPPASSIPTRPSARIV